MCKPSRCSGRDTQGSRPRCLSVEEVAEILDRADRVDEVIKKCRELGLTPKKGKL
jgi:hypothetical protein